MGSIVKQMFYYNYFTKDGMKFGYGWIRFDDYSFMDGLIGLGFDAILFILLGFYLDQVMPSPYGVSKPWNFCCKSKPKSKVKVDIEADPEDW